MMGDYLMEAPGRIARIIGGLMLLQAATFAVASLVHFDVTIPLGILTIRGEPFTGAAIPEAILAGVLAGGAIGVLASPRGSLGLALATTLFAIAGVLIGLSFVLPTAAFRPGDVAYHVTILATLIVTVILLLTPPARRAMRR